MNSAGELAVADPVLEHFLSFLASDIAKHPERLQTVDEGIEVDLDATLAADGE